MIYLDNAATTFPKPPHMAKTVYNYMLHCGASYGRGGYKTAMDSMDILWQARENISYLIGNTTPDRLIFTKNATEGLNLVIKGMLENNSNVIISPMEHNSVMRPLHELNCSINILPLKPDGSCDVSFLSKNNLTNIDMVIINHGSNVSGVINDVEIAAKICSDNNIPLLIDASQTVGTIPIFADAWEAFIGFSGHKGLLGPQGTGAVYIPKKYSPAPLLSGGTGSNSESINQPEILPDKYESGTMNMPAIAGIAASCEYIKSLGMDNIYNHEQSLTKKIIEGLSIIKDVNVLCPDNKYRTSAVSFYTLSKDTNEIGNLLDKDYNIAVRCGLHCAPMAHKAYNTLETGTVRISPGWFNTKHDIDKLLFAVNKILT